MQDDSSDSDTTDDHAAVWIDGHDQEEYNGLYRRDSTHLGSPVYKQDRSDAGESKYCYRCEKLGANRNDWFINDSHEPDSNKCRAFIASKGPLPTGRNTWQFYDGNAWVSCSLKVTKHVRPHRSFPEVPLGDFLALRRRQTK